MPGVLGACGKMVAGQGSWKGARINFHAQVLLFIVYVMVYTMGGF